MANLLINNINALKTTNYLLEFDLNAIEECYRQDADSWIKNLKAALQIYKSQMHNSFNSPILTQDDSNRMDQSLERLRNYANSMVYILTPVAKEALLQYLLLTTQAIAA